jgi:hypothetical protein
MCVTATNGAELHVTACSEYKFWDAEPPCISALQPYPRRLRKYAVTCDSRIGCYAYRVTPGAAGTTISGNATLAAEGSAVVMPLQALSRGAMVLAELSASNGAGLPPASVIAFSSLASGRADRALRRRRPRAAHRHGAVGAARRVRLGITTTTAITTTLSATLFAAALAAAALTATLAAAALAATTLATAALSAATLSSSPPSPPSPSPPPSPPPRPDHH